MLSLIFARSLNRCIGQNGDLPWSLPEESAFFHRTTMGAAIIMGRRTYEDHNSLLPGRLNVVVTAKQNYPVARGIVVANSLTSALKISDDAGGETFVIGGVSLLIEALPMAARIFETIVDATIDGDTFLPAINLTDFTTRRLLQQPQDHRHRYAFAVFEHVRR